MNSDMNKEIFTFILKDCSLTEPLQSFMFETGYLQNIHTVNVSFQSMANGFQSEVRFAHAVNIVFV